MGVWIDVERKINRKKKSQRAKIKLIVKSKPSFKIKSKARFKIKVKLNSRSNEDQVNQS